jgi:hypothetical protein
MSAPAKTLRIAYTEHAFAKTIIEEYSDGTVRVVPKPKSTAAMDRKRKRYGSRWRSVKSWGASWSMK